MLKNSYFYLFILNYRDLSFADKSKLCIFAAVTTSSVSPID